MIENKVESRQHSDQLARYRHLTIAAYPKAHCVFLLLSVGGETPADPSFRIATYEDVHKTLEKCLQERSGAMPQEPHFVITHYMQLIRNRFMPNSEIEKLARNILRDP